MVRNYVRLRDHKNAAEKEFKAGMARVNEGMKALEAKLLEHFNNNQTNNFSSDFGTAYVSRKFTATVKDRQAFLRFCAEHNQWDALDAKANKTYVKEAAKEGIEVPGVKLSSVNVVGVQRKP